jgi:hypothetical protein
LRSSKEYGVLSSPGINQKIINIYKFLGIYTDHFRQFVLINDKITEFKIAKVSNEKYIKPVRFLTNNKYSLKKLSEKEVLFDFKDYKETIPYKDKKYFIKRYFNHPVYSYDIFGIFKNSKIHSLLVTRSVLANGSKALRIVDFIGDQKGLQFITKNLYEKIIADNYEYADFMCFGFDYEKLLSAGFQQVNLDSSDLIIPNYFSPYVAENIKINFYIDTDKVEKVRMCKADGDQDRPN